LEALEALDNDTVLKNALGEEIYTAFRRAKLEEWDDFRIHVTDWEVEKYLESA
jgi:glutamine synthetase